MRLYSGSAQPHQTEVETEGSAVESAQRDQSQQAPPRCILDLNGDALAVRSGSTVGEYHTLKHRRTSQTVKKGLS